ncbi:hypothetical protein [Pontibacter kalidii]|uniref:hypothetical protein n=1 Tax=Pontibacter kalidii TaxID=2592049 RepID=UPI00225C2F8C|nr:hypothetical protein [Pontibacter kalidii]
MKKHLYNLLLIFILCAGVACGGSTQEQTEGGKAPVSADDPKAPTMAPDKPSTNIGDGLEDSARQIEQSTDSL